MKLLNLQSLPVWLNLAVFGASAVIVWLAGSRLSRYADVIAERTNAGRAFVGALLLGGLTSLPEVATTLTASLGGNAPLAVNNLFGGVSMQVTILAGLDLIVRKRALSSLVYSPTVMLQAALSTLLLILATAGMVQGETNLGWFGLWTLLVFLAAVLALYLVHRYEGSEPWEPTEERKVSEENTGIGKERREKAWCREERVRNLPGNRLVLSTVLAGLAILVAGFFVARSGEAIALQTGLGSSFVGAVMVAIATSLPEISTTYSAILLGNFGMAVSNIFGTNIFDVGILFVADVAYPEGPVLAEVGSFAQFGALLGALVSLIYLVGLLLRRQRTAGHLGLDSLAVLVVYLIGIAVLYSFDEQERNSASCGDQRSVIERRWVDS